MTAPRRALAAALSAFLATGVAVPTPAGAAPSPSRHLLDDSSILTEQQQVVAAAHQGPLALARLAVGEFTADTQRDDQAVAGDQAAQARAEATAAAAATRLTSDRAALAAADRALAGAQAQLADDRARLAEIAVGMYTGALTDPQPASLQQLEADQIQAIDAAEVEVVAGVVDGHVHGDLLVAAADTQRRSEDSLRVGSDLSDAAQAHAAALVSASRTVADRRTLDADQTGLAAANAELGAAEAGLSAALISVAGPTSTPPGQLSLLGGSALSATQLVGWYNSQGYVDLTSTPIGQLASWYLQAGAEEGVRGDVAFAQAVLETGGFSSPDAVDLNNYAGIGHCDSCAAGWAFPSAQGGVLGQVQLLRIFADAGPAPARPSPVLPSLTPAQQGSAGCCSTVQSLTGVWATDPTYGQQILEIYAQMLSFALAPA